MCSNFKTPGGPSGRGGRTVVRLDATALWDRLGLLNCQYQVRFEPFSPS